MLSELADGLPEADHDRLPGLVDGEQRAVAEDQREQNERAYATPFVAAERLRWLGLIWPKSSFWEEAASRMVWNTFPCAIFFVKDPQFLELELLPAENNLTAEASINTIKAKIGLDFLTQDSALSTNGEWIVRFSAPADLKYRSGVQPAFLAMVPPEQLGEYATVSSPWILKRVSWRKE